MRIKMNAAQRAHWQGKMNKARLQFHRLYMSSNIRELMKRGAYNEVINLCKKMLTLDPTLIAFNRLLLLARYKRYLHQGKFKEAHALYSTCHDAQSALAAYNPFNFIRLIAVSSQTVGLIQSIEGKFDQLKQVDLKLVVQMVKHPDSVSGCVNKFYQVALQCYQEIMRVQEVVAQRIVCLMQCYVATSDAGVDIAPKAIWLSMDEMLFLLGKCKVANFYFRVLQAQLKQYPCVMKFNSHPGLLMLSQQCRESIALGHPPVYAQAISWVQKHMASHKRGVPVRAYQHLDTRMNRLLPHMPMCRARLSSEISNRQLVPRQDQGSNSKKPVLEGQYGTMR